MKSIYYASLGLVILLSSCSQTRQLSKAPEKNHDTVAAAPMGAHAAYQSFMADYGHNTAITVTSRDYYRDALCKLQAMLNGQQTASFKDAVFITENAWYDESLSYDAYSNYITALSTVSKAWEKANPLKGYTDEDSAQVALSGAIYKIMTDTTRDDKGHIISLPYGYNFNDAFADKCWTDRFVTTLMNSHAGNCHSLPFLYKIVAEQLHIPAYLSFLPEHIYIKQYAKQYNWYNTELTSHTFPVDGWLMASGYVSTASIVSGIYMDTLSLRQSIAVCVNDLAKGYAREFSNGDGKLRESDLQFVLNCCNVGLTYYPNYAELLLLKAETQKKLYERGQEDIADVEQTYTQLVKLDYREIPDGMYYRWMSSLVKGDTIWNRKADSLIKPVNPYASIGKQPKGYLTLSNGYYDESFVNDTLRQLGSVVFNTITNKIENLTATIKIKHPRDDSRFLSIDPMAAKYPQQSPYLFASNSPIQYVDIDGKYKYDAKDAKNFSKKYPVLTQVLQSYIHDYVENSKEIVNGLVTYAGNKDFTAQKVDEATTWGSGPTINIVDKPGKNGDAWMAASQFAWGHYDAATNTIDINEKFAEKFEQIFSDKNSTEDEKKAALYSLYVGILHETTHYGNEYNNHDKSPEPGWDFVSNVFETYDNLYHDDIDPLEYKTDGNGNVDWTPGIDNSKKGIEMDKADKDKQSLIPAKVPGDAQPASGSQDSGQTNSQDSSQTK